MPRKFVTLGIFSIVLIAFTNELIKEKVVKMRVCENEDCVIMLLLRNGDVVRMS